MCVFKSISNGHTAEPLDVYLLPRAAGFAWVAKWRWQGRRYMRAGHQAVLMQEQKLQGKLVKTNWGSEACKSTKYTKLGQNKVYYNFSHPVSHLVFHRVKSNLGIPLGV